MIAFHRLPWLTSSRGLAGVFTLALLLAPLGCKNKDGGPSSNLTNNDPLLSGPGRIPRQNVPVPERGTAGGRRTDPLLGSPTSGTRANSSMRDDPERWKKGPYVPGPGGSPAALAGFPINDGEGLSIDLPGGVGLTPAGGTAPKSLPAPAAPLGSDASFAELARYGVKRGDYSIAREDGYVVVRVRVPISADGPTRGYTGRGATEAAAVKQVVDQLKPAR